MGVPEGEHPAVTGHLPVSLGVCGGGEPDDRGNQSLPTHRAVEVGVPEGEDTAVTGHLPIALAIRSGRDLDDRRVQLQRTDRPEARHPPVGGHMTLGIVQPVAGTPPCRW